MNLPVDHSRYDPAVGSINCVARGRRASYSNMGNVLALHTHESFPQNAFSGDYIPYDYQVKVGHWSSHPNA
jgi:hypothetical protein